MGQRAKLFGRVIDDEDGHIILLPESVAELGDEFEIVARVGEIHLKPLDPDKRSTEP